MDEYYDDGYEDEDNLKKHEEFDKIKTNPAGPYKISLTFKGVKWSIKIENIAINKFKINAKSNIKVARTEVDILKKYLKDEGFEMAAKKHNLFW